MTTDQILKDYSKYKETSLAGRYITLKDIEPLIKKWSSIYSIETLGFSENKKPTLYIVPMLNPDGSELYTRVNFNEIDLNRDAQALTQAESSIFKTLVDRVEPLIAFNLHGQRTIFSAGETNKSATVSFLSPASNKERTITESRKKGMQIIAEMNTALQKVIPNGVGRYDDGFNINCTGDTLENRGITTILFEAGHHPEDYAREITRKWMYLSLVTAINYISKNTITGKGYKNYFNIPENGKCFLNFVPYISDIQNKLSDFGHLELDSEIDIVNLRFIKKELKIDAEIAFIEINDKEFSVFPIIY